jgi:hypothetical protein
MEAGNFTIKQSNRITLIDYKRTLKDWIDTFAALIISSGLIVFLWFMYIHTHFRHPIFWIVALLCVFAIIVKLPDGLLRLFQKTSPLIIVSQEEQRLISHLNRFKKIDIDFADIKAIILRGTNVSTTFKGSPRRSIYATVLVKTINGKEIEIAYINMGGLNFDWKSSEAIEKDIYKTGAKLAGTLAYQVGVSYQWSGYKRKRI